MSFGHSREPGWGEQAALSRDTGAPPAHSPAAGLGRTLIAIGILVSVVALTVRLYGLGAILTIDEPQWIFRSSSFYRALSTGDPGGTFQGTHPGVIPMFLIGGGIRLQELTSGTTLVSPDIGEFRRAAKLPISLVVSLGIGVAAAIAARLWGPWVGVGVGSFLALDPQLLGHSQLAHVDALLSVFFLLSVLSLLLALRTGETRTLLLSGFFCGLAALTKIPALVLFPLVFVFLFMHSFQRARALGPTLGTSISQFARWCAVVAGMFVLLWPSMWINALPNARYAARDAHTVTASLSTRDAAESTGRAPWFFVRALVARQPPVTLLLAAGGVLLLLRRPRTTLGTGLASPETTTDEDGDGRPSTLRGSRRRRGAPGALETIVLLATAIGFLVFLTLLEKKADRYALPALAIVNVFAGISVAALLGGISRHQAAAARLLGIVVVGALLLQDLLLAPYAIAYVSPLAGREEPTQSGWGEGLERAAAVLAAHPLGRELFVASWYPTVFREFFPGQTMSLSSRDDPRVSFVVLYRNMRGRAPDSAATDILEEYREKKPVATIRVLGEEKAWIYQTDFLALFRKNPGELVGAHALRKLPPAGSEVSARAVELGQFVFPEEDEWSGVRLAFATFSSRHNTADVVVHIRQDPDGPDLRAVRMAASTLEDGAWRVIPFPPLHGVRGTRHYIAVTSEAGTPGNAVTIRYQPVDVLPGSAVVLRQPLKPNERREQFQRDGDFAYDLVYS